MSPIRFPQRPVHKTTVLFTWKLRRALSQRQTFKRSVTISPNEIFMKTATHGNFCQRWRRTQPTTVSVDMGKLIKKQGRNDANHLSCSIVTISLPRVAAGQSFTAGSGA